MEQKTIEMFTKSIEDRVVTGIASVFGNVDDGGDRIWKGAFKKTIKENLPRVKHLWMHDPFQPPTAVVKSLREVGLDDLPDSVKAAYPDATGGLEVAREYLRTPRGDEILEGIRSGALNQMSFGYDPVKFDFEELAAEEKTATLVRNLREVRLWDISDVNWGMNPATVASKSFAPYLEAYKEKIQPEQYGLFAQLANTVETALSPAALKEGRVLSSRNLERLKAALETLSEILLNAEPPEDEEALKALTSQILMGIQLRERELTFIGL